MNLQVNKTYKLYIDGKFPRTESGRYYKLNNPKGGFVANMCLSSRKDFRNAVVAARGAQSAWQDRSAYNKSQIVYRIAEMLQSRDSAFMAEMGALGMSSAKAKKELEAAVDLIVYYAGWCDKYTQVFSSVNPVATGHFNFSLPEPMGVIAAVAPTEGPLLGLIQAVIPAICGGNTIIALASSDYPTVAISFAEVLATSDLPGGVVNILTGEIDELSKHFASHMDVNALVLWDLPQDTLKEMSITAADNVKRVRAYTKVDFDGNPDYIIDLQETKTTWHPIEHIKGSGSGY